MSSIFITGISGYIGRRLAQRLDCLPFDRIYCLCRNPSDLHDLINSGNAFYPIQGSLEDTNSYSQYLAECETVVHLAARTGKGSRDEYFQVNTSGTELLVRQCQKMGVKNILYISTIAAAYKDKSNYYYALSKEQGERVVQESGIRYTIVRPTIVIGENSANWKGLSTLAKAPVIPLFGDGSTHIQPIYVDDLIDGLIDILKSNLYDNRVLGIGGPDTITFKSFMKQIHFEYYQRNAVVLKLPLPIIKKMLSILERIKFVSLPITAGQLSAFSNDGTVQPNDIVNNLVNMKGAVEMVKLVVGLERSNIHSQFLESECRVFTNYLVGREPSKYITEKYCEAHKYTKLLDDRNAAAFDKFLLNYSVKYPFLIHLMDSYTSLFYKKALFRNKLVLMTAIMESTAPTYPHYAKTDSPNMVILGLKLSLRMVMFGLSMLIAIILFSPIRLGTSLRPGPVIEGEIS